LLKIAQPFFSENLIFEINTDHWQAIEYQIKKVIPKKGFFSFTHRPLVAQVYKNDDEKANWKLEIVVFDPCHEELAKALVAPYTMIYGGKMRIRIVHDPVSL